MTDVFKSVDRAIRAGFVPSIDLTPEIFQWRPPSPDPDVSSLFSRLAPPKPRVAEHITAQWSDPARDTRAKRYQDVGYTWESRFEDGLVYEIGRFIAGPSELGVVKYCGTFVDIDGVQLNPGDPYTLQNNGVEARFILRLHQGTYKSFGPAWTGPYSECFGYGFGPLPVWRDYRFFWGRTANDVFWLVPRNHALRLYMRLISGQRSVTRILGRMQGYTQPVATIEAAHSVHHDW